MGSTLLTDTQQPDDGGATPEVALLLVGAARDVGRQAKQEDALGVLLPANDAQAERGSLFVLADGRGSRRGGGAASREVVEVIGAAYYNSPLRQPANLLQSAIDQANRRLVSAAQSPATEGLCSTCVCAAVQGDTLWLADVGDCRGYLLRPPAGLRMLSEEQPPSPQALGTRGGIQPHFAEPTHLSKGDIVLLCSEGLYSSLEPRLMQDYLSAALLNTGTIDPDRLAHDLVEGARYRGAAPNISALVIYCADVVPEAVARAAGWPEQQARRLLSPGPTLAAATTAETPSASPPPAPAQPSRPLSTPAESAPSTPPVDTERGFPFRATDPLASLIAQVLGRPSAFGGDRGGPAPGPDPVSQALNAAMGRARQQWLFNLLVALLSVALVLAGCVAAVLTWVLGRDGLFAVLFGSGLGLVGVLSWLVTQPAAQLNRASAQISLLSISWVNYSQEVKGCSALSDPSAASSCNDRAGAQAVRYFDQIIGGPST